LESLACAVRSSLASSYLFSIRVYFRKIPLALGGNLAKISTRSPRSTESGSAIVVRIDRDDAGLL
jgi:hypothetical protein